MFHSIGIVVPDRMEGERKKVVYGSRTRTKKDKPIGILHSIPVVCQT